MLTSFCLASDPRQEKRQSRMPVDLKKAEFVPAGVQARSPSCTFNPEVTGAGGKFQSKNYTGQNAISYINNNHKNKHRKIIWFNPPYGKLSNINIGKYFLTLINKHFQKNNS